MKHLSKAELEKENEGGKKMSILHMEIKEKEIEMMQRNHGRATLSIAGLCRELGCGDTSAKAWAAQRGIGVQVGDRIRYEISQVAKAIVQERGMY